MIATSRDRGATLAEMAVVMLVLGIVVALAAQFLISFAKDANTAALVASRVDGVRLAMESVDRQVRSGDVLYLEPPGNGCGTYGVGGNCLRVATEADGTARCVQLQLVPDSSGDGSYDLRTRAYSLSWASDGVVGAWRQVTNGLRPPTVAAPAFALTQQSGVGSQAVTVRFAADSAAPSAAPITLTATFVPRNAVYASSTACSGGAPA